jgi:hypothetical protein
MEEEIQFYRAPGHYTDPKEFRFFLQSLPDNLEEIIRFIKAILIHPIEARNNDVKFNYKKALRSQLDYRSIDHILSEPHVSALLSKQTLDIQSNPSQRGIFSCDHHAVVFASVLRLKGKPVRVRCGYATYLIPDRYTPHWICEIYNEQKRKWKSIDPEQAILNLVRGSFLPAGKAWLAVRKGQIALEKIVPDYRTGSDGVKYRLLNDINALMKNEFLNYDWIIKEAMPRPPKLFSKSVSNLDETEQNLLTTLAEISSEEEPSLSIICTKYQTYVHVENLWSEEPTA